MLNSKINEISKSMTQVVDRKIETVKSEIETSAAGKLNDLETKLRALQLASLKDTFDSISRTMEKNFASFQVEVARDTKTSINDSALTLK